MSPSLDRFFFFEHERPKIYPTFKVPAVSRCGLSAPLLFPFFLKKVLAGLVGEQVSNVRHYHLGINASCETGGEKMKCHDSLGSGKRS